MGKITKKLLAHKKTFFAVLAILAILAAVVGVWNLQRDRSEVPQRQETEIR